MSVATNLCISDCVMVALFVVFSLSQVLDLVFPLYLISIVGCRQAV